MTIVNPTIPTTALLRPQMPGTYKRGMIYDTTWDDPSYSDYTQKIVPAVGSIVQDSDGTALWVIAIEDVTLIPSYTAIPFSSDNDNVVSMLNYGNSLLRLYTDYRKAPYPVTPDSKCIFIGKSPRFYTLTRYPRTANASVISQYYDSTGNLTSQMVPLKPLDDTNTSWYLQRSHINTILEDNEEIDVTIYNEDGVEVYTARLFAKESSVINEDIIYSPTIMSMTVTSNQRLANGNFFLYEKQDFQSLGLNVTIMYDDGSSYDVPIDGVKCVLYGKEDFISSFSGLLQYVTVKYFRTENEAISSTISDSTGSMISIKVPVMVIPNTLGTTVKIMAMPYYNASISRYVIKHYLYFGDGRASIDISGYVSYVDGAPVTDSSRYGVTQTYIVKVDMKDVDPTNYPTSAIYQQTVVITFGAPNEVVKWTIRDSSTSPYIYGQDISSSKRPSIRYDSTRHQYFIPSYIFSNLQAFMNSFFYKATPPYDPAITEVPETPTHFVIRNVITGAMIISSPIPVESYSEAFNILNDTTGLYKNATVIVEFIKVINVNTRKTIYGAPVDVSSGTYVG